MIRVSCRSCGQELDSDQVDASVRCRPCRARASIALELRQYGRLWRKRARYQRSRADLTHLDEQVARLEARMARRVLEHIINLELAAQVLGEAVEREKGVVSGRIVLPPAGGGIVVAGS